MSDSSTHLRLSWGDVLAVHYQTGDYTSLGIWAQDNVPSLIEQLEAFQELAQDASDITQVGHGLELDVPVNLGSVKWVESAYHVLLTMASLASNPAKEPSDA